MLPHLTKTLHLLPCQPSNAYYKLIQKKYTLVQKQYSEILMHSSLVCQRLCQWKCLVILTLDFVQLGNQVRHVSVTVLCTCKYGVIKCTSLCYYLPRVYSLIIIILLHWKTGECMIYISKESRHSQTLSHNVVSSTPRHINMKHKHWNVA